jgi:DNA-binding transcriptional LysR family regulator
MDKDDLNGLLVLKVVAERRSFRAAAADLSVSPAAVSKTIGQVERRLGVALLSRTTRSTSLTEAGARFLEQAGPALDQILVAIKGVGSYAQKPAGLLRINLPRATYHSRIDRIVATFTEKYPEITVELYFEDEASDVVESGFDAGIRHSDILAKDMIALKLFGPIRFVVVGSRKYLTKRGRPKVPKDLLAHDCIRLRFGATSIYDRWEFENRGRDIQVHVNGSLIINDPLLGIEAAVAGRGLTYTVDNAVEELVRAGRLEEVLVPYAPESTGYYLYFPQRSQTQPKLRAFVEHVQSRNWAKPDYGAP